MKKLVLVIMIMYLAVWLAMPISASNLNQNNGIEFPFTVILTDEEGNELEGEFSYTGTKSGAIKSGDTIYLGDTDYIDIESLPEGTQYNVIEGETDGFELTTSNNTSGSITDEQIAHAEFINSEEFTPMMPSTGGSGTSIITAIGLVMMATTLCVECKLRAKR